MRIQHFALALVLLATPALAAEGPFLTATQVDLMRLLPPPPAAGSAQEKAEMAEIVAIENSRTPARTARARADAAESVFDMFTPTLGAAFAKTALPIATPFFERLAETEEDVTGPAKKGFRRLRPYLVNTDLHPAAPTSRNGSYPSGHATRVTLIGTVLAAMLPEHRAAIFARIEDYAESRVVAGVHYRSDIVAGRQAGAAIHAVLVNDPAFKAAFGPARAEVRKALSLPN